MIDKSLHSCSEEELTPSQRDFIGCKFVTPSGSYLQVSGVSESKTSNSTAIFICVCSICSVDKELWPYGSIVATKSMLSSGRITCGCSKSPKWQEWQNKIKVKRECEKRGYIFHGWYRNYKGCLTTLSLENISTGNRWNTTSINNLLRGHGDPEEGKQSTINSSMIEDSIHIKDFMCTGKFLKGTIFWRSDRVNPKGCKPYWNYTCPLCSNDEYVKAGVCSGTFEKHIGSLKRGEKSCRCSKSYRWTQEQREYQINKICKDEGLTFVGWESLYENNLSKIQWVCSKGHNRCTPIGKFLNGNRCKHCVSGFNGYYKDRVDEKDYLYLLDFGKYIKVGRSFDICRRKKQLVNLSGVENIAVLKVFTCTHRNVYDTEQWIHSRLRDLSFSYEGLWSSELFHPDCKDVLFYLTENTSLKDCSKYYLNSR